MRPTNETVYNVGGQPGGAGRNRRGGEGNTPKMREPREPGYKTGTEGLENTD